MADVEQLVRRWVRPAVQAIKAYHVADATGLIKLDAMENPHVWPDELREEWAQGLSRVDVNRYPDPHATDLAAAIRDYAGVPEAAGMLLGNGSDEIIQMLALALGGEGRTLLSVEPGFVMYRMVAAFSGLGYRGVDLRGEDFTLDMDALLAAIAQEQPAVVFLAYPNNPTGNLFARDQVERVIAASPGLVVVDEAYAPFADDTFLPQAADYPNLLVMRTLSKWGLAGLRLGFIAGPQELIGELDKVRLPYNINVLTQFSTRFALEHATVFERQTHAIRLERARMSTGLARLDGVVAFPSQANFVLARLPDGRGPETHARLRDGGILVKSLDGAHPSLKDCLRLTVGTAEENSDLLEQLATIVASW